MPTIDASTPPWVAASSAAGTNSLTTASFTPPLGALLVVLYSCPYANTAMVKPTNIGGGVTWENTAAVSSVATTTKATGIWRGVVNSSAAMTVSESTNVGNVAWATGVAVVTNQYATQAGRTNTATSSSGTPSVTLTNLVGSNSLCLGVVADVSAGATITPGTGQSDVFNGNTFAFSDATNGFAEWAQYATGMNVAAGGSQTLNVTSPTGIIYSFSALEITDVNGVTPPVVPYIPRRMPLGV